jgi:hypothetical protein
MAEAWPLHWPEGWPRTPAHDQADSRNRWGRGEGRKRRPWTFGEARNELYQELERFGAGNVVLSSNFRLTREGIPSKNFGVPEDQGVAIYFTLGDRQMVMAQDGHMRAEENLRALALVLKYLRGVEDLGGGTMMEKAFAGFEALPAPEPTSQRTWREVLKMEGFEVAMTDASMIEGRYRALAKKLHPDAGGSVEAFHELQQAREEALKAIGERT